jgi:hypothetical protein
MKKTAIDTNTNTEVADEDTQLTDEQAKQVIDAVEPLLNQNKKASKPRTVKPKSINLYNDQPLQVTLESGLIMKLTFTAPLPK